MNNDIVHSDYPGPSGPYCTVPWTIGLPTFPWGIFEGEIDLSHSIYIPSVVVAALFVSNLQLADAKNLHSGTKMHRSLRHNAVATAPPIPYSDSIAAGNGNARRQSDSLTGNTDREQFPDSDTRLEFFEYVCGIETTLLVYFAAKRTTVCYYRRRARRYQSLLRYERDHAKKLQRERNYYYERYKDLRTRNRIYKRKLRQAEETIKRLRGQDPGIYT